MNNLCFLVYTNENNLPILKLFLKYFFDHNPSFSYPIYVVSNNFTETNLPYSDKVIYLSGNVDWDSTGVQFSSTLTNVLSQINEDYVFYFCDDYILTDPIDTTTLENLLNLIQDQNIDLFSFASTNTFEYNRPVLSVNYSDYGLENNVLHVMDTSYKHAYSVQPCIWKKSSLQQLLLDNPSASLHNMDRGELNNKESYNIACTHFKIYDLCCPSEYFVIGYKEILRHGVFLMNLNGHHLSEDNPHELFIQQLIKDNDLHNNPEYDKYIGFDKSLITW